MIRRLRPPVTAFALRKGKPMSLSRHNTSLQISYLRFKVNFNDAGVAAGAPKQVLPAGALVLGTDVFVTTAFNAATTNVLEAGSAAGGNADLVGAALAEGAIGLTQNIAPTGIFLAPLAADTPVFAQYTQTGAVATAGAAYFVIKYVEDNDLNIGQ